MADGRYLKAAALSPFNLVALGAAALASLAILNPLPILTALGAELILLGALPSIPGFRRLVDRRIARERSVSEAEQLERMVGELSASQRDDVLALRELRDRVLANYRRLPAGSVLLESSAQSIDAMLAAFVRLLHTLDGYRRFLDSTSREELQRELEALRRELTTEKEAANPSLHEVKARRLAILERRLERFDRARENRELISHQLASIEELMRLLHEQSITARSPQALDSQLERLSFEIEATDQAVADMDRFLAVSQDPLAIPSPERQSTR